MRMQTVKPKKAGLYLVVKGSSNDDGDVEQLVGVEVDVKGSRFPALGYAQRIHCRTHLCETNKFRE